MAMLVDFRMAVNTSILKYTNLGLATGLATGSETGKEVILVKLN